MFLQHHAPLVTGIFLIVAALVAGFYVWNTPRAYGSPRWPVLALFLGVALHGVGNCFMQTGHHMASSGLILISDGLLFFAAGAVGTQWLHESLLRQQIVRQ